MYFVSLRNIHLSWQKGCSLYLLLIGIDDTELVITVPSVCRLSPQLRHTFTQHPQRSMYFITLMDVENKHSSFEFFPDTLRCVLENTFVPPEPAADLVSIARCVGFNFLFWGTVHFSTGACLNQSLCFNRNCHGKAGMLFQHHKERRKREMCFSLGGNRRKELLGGNDNESKRSFRWDLKQLHEFDLS